MSASAKPRLAGRQPSRCGGVLRVIDRAFANGEGKRNHQELPVGEYTGHDRRVDTIGNVMTRVAIRRDTVAAR